MALELERTSDGKMMKGLVPVPPSLSRFVALPTNDDTYRFIALEDIFEDYLGMLFPGFTVKEYGMFRIIRDSDLGINEKAEDLVAHI